MNSIFHNLVTKENDFTQLLFNLMERLDDFRTGILELLLPGIRATDITAEQIGIQTVLWGYGRPDIEISAGDLYALVEVKVDLGCGLTLNQEIEPDSAAELKGYLRNLARRKARDRRLVFLVPRHWIFLPNLQKSLASQKSVLDATGVDVQINYWENVLELINLVNPASRAPFLEEFRTLLADRFGPIIFSKEEIQMLYSTQFVDAWLSIQKLQFMIDQVKNKGKDYGYAVSTEKTKEAYGVYFSNGSTERQLWFGMWAPFSQEYGSPLCFGVQDSKAAKRPELKCALESVCGGATKQCRGWTMGWISKETLETPDPLHALWTQLAPTLRSVLGDPPK